MLDPDGIRKKINADPQAYPDIIPEVTQQLVEARIGVDDDCPHGLKYTPTASPQISLIRI